MTLQKMKDYYRFVNLLLKFSPKQNENFPFSSEFEAIKMIWITKNKSVFQTFFHFLKMPIIQNSTETCKSTNFSCFIEMLYMTKDLSYEKEV